MIYKSLISDFYYENSGITSLSYYIAADGGTLYTGKAFNPKGIKINIRKAIDDWLVNEMPDFREYDGVMVEHPDALKIFYLYDDGGTLLETYQVLLDHAEPYNGGLITMNRLIDGRADPRQKIFYGLASETSGHTFDLDSKIKDAWIEFSGPFHFGYESGVTTICYTASTDYTLTGYSGGWFTVVQSKADDYHGCLTFTYDYNSGDSRDGSVCFEYEDYKGTHTVCFPVEQDAYVEQMYFRFTTLDNVGIGSTVTAYTVNWETNYPLIVYAFMGTSAVTSDSGATVTFPASTSSTAITDYEITAFSQGGLLLGTLRWRQMPAYSYGEEEFECFYLDILSDENDLMFQNYAGTFPIEYSKDSGQTWTPVTTFSWPSGRIPTQAGDRVYFRGNNPYGLHYVQGSIGLYDQTGFLGGYGHLTLKFNAGGNVMSLMYGDNFVGKKTLTTGREFEYLFRNTNIVSAEKLCLPATSITYDSNRFSDDVSPYRGMFEGCSGLTKGPAVLPATDGYITYGNMYKNCSSLTEAPVIFASEVQNNGYSAMFQGCSSLREPPVLLATVMKYGCYSNMFYGCSNLKYAPALVSTSLDDWCYSNMFDGCSSITEAPKLPATRVYDDSYTGMFANCTSLTEAPELPATEIGLQSYYLMFEGCTSLSSARYPLPAQTLKTSCYDSMFNGCSALVEAPDIMATTISGSSEFVCQMMFQNCTSLVTAPSINISSTCNYGFSGMFKGCTSLVNPPELKAKYLSTGCYSSMFEGCTSLRSAPELSATWVDKHYAYKNMFKGCTYLNYVKCLASSIYYSDATEDWLQGVSPTGTFVKDPGRTWSTGDSGVPSGWTVVDAV